jgi:hypothetical protein
VFATLDELYATDADTPTKRERIREMIASEQQRRHARRTAAGQHLAYQQQAAQAQQQWPRG